jgi:hypothetical protein
VAADDPVGKKLDDAKWAYLQATDTIQADIVGWFDRREQAARKDGKKRLVDQIRAERQTFEARLELPHSAPASLKKGRPAARLALRAAYLSAVKEYTRVGNDQEAAAVESELAAFDSTNQTRSRWVHDRGEFRLVGSEIWAEKSPDGKVYSFREIDRNKDYIELDALNGNTATRVRLRDSTADYGYEPQLNFGTGYSGKWAE